MGSSNLLVFPKCPWRLARSFVNLSTGIVAAGSPATTGHLTGENPAYFIMAPCVQSEIEPDPPLFALASAISIRAIMVIAGSFIFFVPFAT
jgi:hypothetical protein